MSGDLPQCVQQPVAWLTEGGACTSEKRIASVWESHFGYKLTPLYAAPTDLEITNAEIMAIGDTVTTLRKMGQQNRDEMLRGLADFFSESVHDVWSNDEIADCLIELTKSAPAMEATRNNAERLPSSDAAEVGADTLTPDQVAYLHERADETRRRWAEHARSSEDSELQEMRDTGAIEAFQEADFAILYREVEDCGTTSKQEIFSVPQVWCREIAAALSAGDEAGVKVP